MEFRNSIFVLFILLVFANMALAATVHFALVNDCHAIMETFGPRDPASLEAPYGGYPRAVTVLNWLRELYPDIICVHAGDIISGDFLSTTTRGLAMYDLWLAAGIRVFAIGNHEFEYGPYVLDSILGMMDVPLVCANLDAPGFPNLQAAMEPYRIFPVPGDEPGDTIRIAIVGLCTQETNVAGWPDPLELTDIIPAVDTLTLPPEVDASVALTHLSYWDDESLGTRIPWLDAIIGGHDHAILEEPIWAYHGSDSTPIVKAGAYNRCVGHLAMEYVPGEGLEYLYWEAIHLNDAIAHDPSARAMLDVYRDYISAHPRVGLDPYSTVAFYAESDISNHPVASGGTGYSDTPEGNLVTDAYRAVTSADVAFDARGSLRMRIYEGPVTYADLFRAMPMGLDEESGLNAPLVVFEVSGAQLRELLEISLYGSDIDYSVFPEFSGMHLRFNPNGFPFTRVQTDSWTVGGEPWNDTETYLIGGNTLLIFALDMIGYSIPGVDTLDITAYEALVEYCTDPDFVPRYESAGRLINIDTGVEESPITIDKFDILCYPNPFNSIVNIEIAGVRALHVTPLQMEIYDMNGRLVISDREGCLSIQGKDAFPNLNNSFPQSIGESGSNDYRSRKGEFSWRPEPNVSSGLYLVKVRYGEFSDSRKVLYLK
ncbi:5'-nucleotidase C-terminal domain-containing protein [bacterium]|nr:5'-nucleotidase C-terminal domain-containing protein [bacterium]